MTDQHYSASAVGQLDIHTILHELATVGATSVPILTEEFRLSLLREAEAYEYKREEEVVGSGHRIVRQQLGSFEDFAPDSQFILLKNIYQELLDNALAEVQPYPFAAQLHLNAMALQKYEKGSIGITPHLDQAIYINLVSVFVIGGRGRFYVCADRSGRDAREIEATPGNAILMRAPGFLGSSARPFHFVTDIQETRYTFGLRQKRSR